MFDVSHSLNDQNCLPFSSCVNMCGCQACAHILMMSSGPRAHFVFSVGCYWQQLKTQSPFWMFTSCFDNKLAQQTHALQWLTVGDKRWNWPDSTSLHRNLPPVCRDSRHTENSNHWIRGDGMNDDFDWLNARDSAFDMQCYSFWEYVEVQFYMHFEQ